MNTYTNVYFKGLFVVSQQCLYLCLQLLVKMMTLKKKIESKQN